MPRTQENTTKPFQIFVTEGEAGIITVLDVGETVDYNDTIWSRTEHDDIGAVSAYLTGNNISFEASSLSGEANTQENLEALGLTPVVDQP